MLTPAYDVHLDEEFNSLIWVLVAQVLSEVGCRPLLAAS
jgi:hypothetical protein